MSLYYSLALFHSSTRSLLKSPDSFLLLLMRKKKKLLPRYFYRGRGNRGRIIIRRNVFGKCVLCMWDSRRMREKMKTNEKTPLRRGRNIPFQWLDGMFGIWWRAYTIEKRWTILGPETAAKIVIIIRPQFQVQQRTDGQTERVHYGRGNTNDGFLSLATLVIMSCLLGDLPVRILFFFFSGRPSLLSSCRAYRELRTNSSRMEKLCDEDLVYIFFFSIFCGARMRYTTYSCTALRQSSHYS
jgi:hypothetical protein